MSDKPPFDPSAPFEAVAEAAPGGGAKPAFDPTKPYSVGSAAPVPAKPTTAESVVGYVGDKAKDALGGLYSVVGGGGGESIGARVPIVGALGKNLGERFRAGVDYLGNGGDVPYSALLDSIRSREAADQSRFAEEHPGANAMRNVLGGAGAMVLPVPGSMMGGAAGAATRIGGVLTGAGTDALIRTEDPNKVRQAATLAGGLQAGLEAIPLVGRAGKAIGTALEPVAEGVSNLGTAARDKLFQAGELLTAGNLKAAQASKAADQLSGWKMLFPGSENFGPLANAGEKVGAARAAIDQAQPMLEDPKALQTLQKVRDIITGGEERALRTPGSQAVLDKIDNVIAKGQEAGKIPLQTVDDLVRNMDEVGYTGLGNERSLSSLWKGPVTSARRELNGLLQGAEEGQALQGAKDQYSALSTAAKGRSKLMEGLSNVGAAASTGALAHGIVSGNPLAMAAGGAAFAISKAMSPRTYFQLVGAARLPSDAVSKLTSSYQSGNIAALRDTIQELAERNPGQMSRFIEAVTEHAVTAQPSQVQSPITIPIAPNNDQRDAIRRRIGE